MRKFLARLLLLLSFTAPVFAAVYSDNFNRPDGALGANWTTVYGDTDNRIVDNQVESSLASGAVPVSLTVWNTTPGNDQFSKAKIISLNSSFVTYVGCRMSGSQATFTGYTAYVNGDDYYLDKTASGGAVTNLITQMTAGDFADGDLLELECVGTTLSIYRTRSAVRTLIDSTTDATYASGKVGIGTGRFAGGVFYFLDDWSGGDVGGSPATAVPVFMHHYNQLRN